MKKEIHFDKVSFQKVLEEAQQKKTTLEQAKEEFTRLTQNEVTDITEFSKGFKAYTIKEIVDRHPEAKALRLSGDKILQLYDYDLSKLSRLNSQYGSDNTGLKFSEVGNIEIDVDQEPFKIYTENDHQNKKLEAIEEMIKACKKVQKEILSTVPIMQVIGSSLSLLVAYDFEKEDVIPHYGAILKD